MEEETTNWDPVYENEDQDENQKNDSADNIFNKNERRKADDDKEEETSEEEGSSDWGSVDPQQDGRPSSNDPSGPGSAV